MTIAEYLSAIKERLLSDPAIARFHVIRERDADIDGHLRVRLELANRSRLEFSEYVQRVADGQVVVVTYSYHWTDAQGNLIKRWDNTPHHPGLLGFPHHIHIGATESVLASVPTDISTVLNEIASSVLL